MSLATFSDGRPAPLLRPEPVRRRRPRMGPFRLLLGAGVKAVLLVGAPVGFAAWVFLSPHFAIHTVEVRGGTRVSADWMEENLAPLRGRHLLTVSLESVSRRLGDHPWVEAVELRRELPDRLRVEVLERVPVALLRRGGELLYLDSAGVPIAAAAAGGDTAGELLVLSAAEAGPVPVAEAIALVEELAAAEPRLAAGIEHLEVMGEGDFRVVSDALDFPVVVRAGEVAAGCARLQAALAAVPRERIGEADVRFPRRVVFRPPPAGAAADINGRAETEG